MAYTTIDDPTQYFNTVIWTGTSDATTSVTGVGHQPDFVWVKNRAVADDHTLHDPVRGGTKTLFSNSTGTEGTNAESIKSFDADGFTTGNHRGTGGNDGNTMVAWCWKANGTGSSNTAGSINTTATSANTTAGISIVTYTGDEGSSATLGHGLGAVPKMIITKGRTYASSWATYHASLGATKVMYLSETDAEGDVNTIWNDTEPTSTLFTVGSSNQVNDDYTYVAYVFAEKQGFSKFGSYSSNGSTDGVFCFCGFRPAWVMFKKTSSTANWSIRDNKRDPFNAGDTNLFANLTDAESSSNDIDFLSNGFKLRTAGSNWNASSQTYIYMAFAEAPFVNSNGVPCNAR